MPVDNSIESVVAEAVKAKVQLMVAEALGDPGDLMTQFVGHALQQKVRDGNSYKDVPLITKLATETVTVAAKAAMVAWLEEHVEEMRREIERQLSAQKKDIASGLVQSLIGVASNQYRFRFTIEESKD